MLRHFHDTLRIQKYRSYKIDTANARLLHGTSKNGRPRAYDITTSAKSRTRVEHRASLVVYDETYKSQEKIDVSSKVLKKSPSKLSLNLAMEELLRKMEEELWVDNVTK